ncbi:chemotaxis protein CheW [Sulfitobacter sp. SK012]|uniref:chemotaxis protein CheW n=1 Tax=Sulfitobacter sp. SK012 TaxID=1389005 RepID=UPI000E0A8C35|nr:chemotaxis protein CheW [Sulfitobacter sp. SK012]AXI46716.1 chemotaxis protein CheW [Sulfitobacter sp. SK012]
MDDQAEFQAIELLTFKLADQEYALDIMSVREIRGWARTTPMPHAPRCMKGVMNLRGTVLPVMDLSERLGLDTHTQNSRNVIIVVKQAGAMIGLLVDAVSDIISVEANALQLPPDMTGNAILGVVSALCLIDERLIRVLDLAEITILNNVAAA